VGVWLGVAVGGKDVDVTVGGIGVLVGAGEVAVEVSRMTVGWL